MPGKPLMLHPQLQLLRTEPSIVIFGLGRTKVDVIKYNKSINIHGSIPETVISVPVMPWLPLTQSCCRHGNGFPSVSQTIICFHIPSSLLTCLLSEGFWVGNICILSSSHASSKEKKLLSWLKDSVSCCRHQIENEQAPPLAKLQ